MPEHENIEPLVRELEPTRDESVPTDIDRALWLCHELASALSGIRERSGDSRNLQAAHRSVRLAAYHIASHHARS